MNSINDELKAINKKNGNAKAETKLEGEFYSKRVTRTQCMKCHTSNLCVFMIVSER